MNVHLGTAFDEFVAGLLKSGYYQTQSEVLREGLRLLKEREDLKQMRLADCARRSPSVCHVRFEITPVTVRCSLRYRIRTTPGITASKRVNTAGS